MHSKLLQVILSILLAATISSCTNPAPSNSDNSTASPAPVTAAPSPSPMVTPLSTVHHPYHAYNSKAAHKRKLTNVNAGYIALEAASTVPIGNYIPDTNYYVIDNVPGNNNGQATVTNSINTHNLANPAPQSVYQTQRWATHITYTFPNLVPNRAYTVRLHFVESWATAAGQRIFGVQINGVQVISNFDIFATAGGQNIAIAKEYTQNANAQGNIVVQMDSTTDNVSIAAIEVFGAWPQSTSAPTPIPTATPAPTPTPANVANVSCAPQGTQFFPVFSACFIGNTPFHHTVAVMTKDGIASVAPNSATIAATVWGKIVDGDINGTGGGNGGLFLGLGSQPTYTPSNVTTYTVPLGEPGNTGNGPVHLPTTSVLETGYDRHNNSADQVSGREWDGYQCSSATACTASGFYPFSGPGFAQNSGISNGAGFSVGVYAPSAQEEINFINSGGTQHFGHALEIQMGYCNPGGVFPSAPQCDSNGGANWPQYGMNVHIKSNVNVDSIVSFATNPVCNGLLHAMQDFGAYLGDTNQGGGTAITYEYLSQYNYGGQGYPNNPWTSFTYNGTSLNSLAGQPCPTKVPAADIEIIQLSSNTGSNGFTSSYPTNYSYGDPRN